MTNNPGDENLLNLGADFDPTAFQAFQAQVAALQDRIEQLNRAVFNGEKGWDGTAVTITKFVNGLNEVSKALDSPTAKVDELSKRIEQLIAEYKGLDSAAQGASASVGEGFGAGGPAFEARRQAATAASRAAAPPTSAPAAGYAEPDVMSGLPDVQKPIGSLFGIGHALSVAGFTLGAPGLKEAGAMVYMEEGLKRSIPLLEQFNKTLTDTPSVASGAIAALTNLGVPLAGIVTVALPVVAAVLGFVAVLGEFKRINDEGAAAIKAGADQLNEFYTLVATSTTDNIAKLKMEQQVKLDSANQVIAELSSRKQAMIDAIVKPAEEAYARGAIDADTLYNLKQNVETKQGIYQLGQQIKTTQTEADAATNKIAEYNNVMKSSAFEQTQLSAVTNQIAAHQANVTQQYLADDQLSSDAARKKLVANEAERASLQQEIDTIIKASAAEGVSTSQRQKNGEIVNELTLKLLDLGNEETHLKDVSIPAAEALEKMAAATSAITKVTQEALTEDIRRADLVRGASGKQTQDLIAKTGSDIEMVEQRIASLRVQMAHGSLASIEALQPEFKALNNQLIDLKDKQTFYKDTLLKIAEAHDRANAAAETHAQQLDAFRKYLDEEAKAKAQEQADIAAENAKYAEERPRKVAEQQAKLADQDAQEGERELTMRQDLALKIADIAQKRNGEYQDDQLKLNQKIEDLQAEHGAKLLELQAKYAEEDTKDLRDHKRKLADAAERLDAQAIYDENQAWLDKQSQTRTQRQEETDQLQAALDNQITRERASLADKYALEAAQDKRSIEEMQSRFAIELKQQQDHYATQRARQVANDGAELAQFDADHRAKLDQIRFQYVQESIQRQAALYQEMQEISDSNRRKYGLVVEGDAEIEREFARFMQGMKNQAANLANGAANVYSAVNDFARSMPQFGAVSTASATPTGSKYEDYRGSTSTASMIASWGTGTFAGGTPDLGPHIRAVTTHPHESINNEDTANLFRSQLGSNYSQEQLQAAFKSRGGVQIGTLSPTIRIDNAGQRSDADLEAIVERGMMKALEKI